VGLASLYLAVGVMSDVLSYARVVALGLATGVIALVVDTLCVMIVGLPWVGFIVAAVVFVVGHSFNIVINVIGAFVHTGRLQFVEFFSKFFVSGGLSWHPFRFKSRYFVLEG
jgi:V/A-type H+-transporting ATPase subunit I